VFRHPRLPLASLAVTALAFLLACGGEAPGARRTEAPALVGSGPAARPVRDATPRVAERAAPPRCAATTTGTVPSPEGRLGAPGRPGPARDHSMRLGQSGLSTLFELDIDPRRAPREPRGAPRLAGGGARPRGASGDDSIAAAVR
jgi:hypothetical protein